MQNDNNSQLYMENVSFSTVPQEKKKCGFKRIGGPFASSGPSFLNTSNFDALALLKISAKGFIIAKFQDILLSFNPTEFF